MGENDAHATLIEKGPEDGLELSAIVDEDGHGAGNEPTTNTCCMGACACGKGIVDSLRRAFILTLATVFGLSFLNFIALRVNLIFFVKHVYHWENDVLSWFSAFQSIVRGIAVIVIVPIVDKCTVGKFRRERLVVIFCLLVTSFIFFVFPYLTNAIGAFALNGLIGLFGTIPFGFIRGQMSRAVKKEEQGKLLSGIASIEVIGGLLGPVTISSLMSKFFDSYRALPFLVMCGVQILATATMSVVVPPVNLMD